MANVFFNFRMYLMHQDAKYFDVAEVALLNNALAGISLKGDSFFYVNVQTQYITDFYGLDRDTFNQVRPEGPLTCNALRIRVLPQVGHCMGIHEIGLSFE